MLAGLFEGTDSPPEGLVAPLFVLAGAAKNRDELRTLLTTVTTPTGPNGRFAVWQYSAFAGLLDAANRAGQTFDQWIGKDSEKSKVNALWASARATVTSPEFPLETRRTAAALLGRDPRQRAADRALIPELLKPQTPTLVQIASVSALARGRDPELSDALLAGWKSYTPALRAAVLDALLSRSEWTAALLSSLENASTTPSEIDPAHRLQLVGHVDATLRAALRPSSDRSKNPDATCSNAIAPRWRRPAIPRPGWPCFSASARRAISSAASEPKLEPISRPWRIALPRPSSPPFSIRIAPSRPNSPNIPSR